MTYLRCGSRVVASNYGERCCLICGWEPPRRVKQAPLELVPVAVAARRCDVAVRTIRRWIEAGKVRGTMPTGSGRVRLVDVGSVANYIAARWTPPRTCEKCGEEIAPPGVQRASRVNQRWCTRKCKSNHHHAARDRAARHSAA